MGKLEGTIKSEIARLAKREMYKTFVPMGRGKTSLREPVTTNHPTTRSVLNSSFCTPYPLTIKIHNPTQSPIHLDNPIQTAKIIC